MLTLNKAGRQLPVPPLAQVDQFKKTVASLISNCYSIHLVCCEPFGITYNSRLCEL